jgi:UDP-N-acetylglucosamine 2-epimerase (non-hydrolysing)
MSRPRRVCVVTGSRADFDLYQPLLAALDAAPAYAVEIAVTGMHFAPELGSTIRQIEATGLPISGRIETLLSGDSPASVAKSCGLGVAGFADLWRHDPPDLVFVLGDRYEMFAAAQAAYLLGLPLAHIAGGDVTNGSLDDGMRHAISKLSHLHFPTNRQAAERLARMGEAPARIHPVGSPALDAITGFDPLPLDEVESRLAWRWRERTMLITMHPDTAPVSGKSDELRALFDALGRLDPAVGMILTLPNADAGGRAAAAATKDFAASRENAVARASLGRELYLSCMAHAAAVVGNSSSGLYEAPSFGIPTVNIGHRQDGRLRATSVIDVKAEPNAILEAIRHALAQGKQQTVNPYGDGRAVERIVAVLDGIADFRTLTAKRFHDGSASDG